MGPDQRCQSKRPEAERDPGLPHREKNLKIRRSRACVQPLDWAPAGSTLPPKASRAAELRGRWLPPSEIDPGDIERVFDAFHTTKPHGMAMGLSINRSIVESHGELWAIPNDGLGVTLEFTL